ncbi:MAG: hypothetical protein RR253_05415 [Oscillospiraceae bacterium]
MKASVKIFLYNTFTVFFAIMAVVSVGGLQDGVSVFRAAVNIGLFTLLSYICYIKEKQLKSALKSRRHRKPKLVGYKSKAVRSAGRAA